MNHPFVDMNHGSGGKVMDDLIHDCFRRSFNNDILSAADDFAALPVIPPGQLVMSTDSYVISPLFFPGGDIGSLAVHGTVNDVAMSGAKPLYLSAAFILEEGFPIADLQRIVASMAAAAREAGVLIVTGDTKVVERGKGDGLYINTCGIGIRHRDLCIGGKFARPGDKIILSGNLGDHGVAILSQRENLHFAHTIQSDSAPLNHMVDQLVTHHGASLHCLRDVTRGGLAAVLNELASQSQVGIGLDEAAIPVSKPVAAACELLGLDPLLIANEGKLVCVCAAEAAEQILNTIRGQKFGDQAAMIGEVTVANPTRVTMITGLGGSRLVDWPMGELLPRIC